jgi:NAD(P)-dependent dehydrogenase (short-subunit alcohol dehydrogenase family)
VIGFTLVGHLALVTGASRGLGRGIALELASAGAEVICVARNSADLENVVSEIGAVGGTAHARPCDVRDESQVAALVRAAIELGDLRVAVCSAGTNRPGPAREYPMEAWDELFDLNVRSTFLTCRAVANTLLDRGCTGSLITMSSQMGTVGYPGRSAYCATKHAVEGLTKALAVEWAPHGIRVNAVAPTFVETPMTAQFLSDPLFREEIERRIPAGRLATVADVAQAVRFLACDASASVTGHVLRVDNGWTAI